MSSEGASGLICETCLPTAANLVPASVAWCPVTNLIATATTYSNGINDLLNPGQLEDPLADGRSSVPVLLLEPSQPDDCYELQVPVQGPEDHVCALDWSHASCRRMLLAATSRGGVVVWSQTPHEDTGATAARLLNQWYGHVVQEAAPAQQQQAETILHAGWLHPLPVRRWSTQQLAAASPPWGQGLEQLFSTEPGAVQLQQQSRYHWVRPGQLALTTVSSSGELRLWWASLGLAPSQLQWQSAAPLQLLPTVSPAAAMGGAGSGAVLCAHVVAAPQSTLRVAMITRDAPHAVHIVQILGNPLNPPPPAASTFLGDAQSAGSRLSAQPLAVIRLPEQLPGAGPLRGIRCALSSTTAVVGGGAGGSLASRLLVLAGNSQAALCKMDTEDHFLATLLDAPGAAGEDQAAAAAAAAPPTSVLLQYVSLEGGADGQHQQWQQQGGSGGVVWKPAPGLGAYVAEGMPGDCLAVSADGSKAAFCSGQTLHVISTEDHSTLLTQALPPPPPQQQPLAVAAFSPAAACVCIVAAAAAAGSGAAQQPSAPEAAAVAADGGSGIRTPQQLVLQVQMVPEAAVPAYPLQQQQQQHSLSPEASAAAAAASGAWQQHADWDALRLAWGLQQRTSTWDTARRVVTLGAVTGWQSVSQTLARLDAFVHQAGVDMRLLYSVSLDKLKLQILAQVPTRAAAATHVDIVARQITSVLYQVLNAHTSMTLPAATHGEEPRVAYRCSPYDWEFLKPWYRWLRQMFTLLCPCVKRWAQLRAAAAAGGGGGGSCGEVPLMRLMLDSIFVRRLFNNVRNWRSLEAGRLMGLQQPDRDPESVEIRATYGVYKDLQDVLGVLLSASKGDQETSNETIAAASDALFPAPLRLHYARVNAATMAAGTASDDAPLSRLAARDCVRAAPDMGHEQLMRRAVELGLLPASHPSLSSPGPAVASDVQRAWRGFRGPAALPRLQADAEPLAPPLPQPLSQQPQGLLSMGGGAYGGGSAPGDAAAAAAGGARKWRRWEAQRAAALTVGIPGALPTCAPGGMAMDRREDQQQRQAAPASRVALAAAQRCTAPLDAITCVALPPGESGWCLESADGHSVTQDRSAVLATNADDANGDDSKPGKKKTISAHVTTQLAHLDGCPLTGAPWKRVRAAGPGDVCPVW